MKLSGSKKYTASDGWMVVLDGRFDPVGETVTAAPVVGLVNCGVVYATVVVFEPTPSTSDVLPDALLVPRAM